MHADAPARLMVMLSGSGRTMLNIADRCDDGTLHAEIARVIASRDCKGVERAAQRGIPAAVIPGEIPASDLLALVEADAIDVVILAGYLRKLSIPPQLEGRVLNIHPALLPGDGTPGRFGGRGLYGRHVHQAVLDAGESESGCTVHVVTPDYDAGPVVLRRTCAVNPNDTAETLAQRVFALELETYPDAIAAHLRALREPTA